MDQGEIKRKSIESESPSNVCVMWCDVVPAHLYGLSSSAHLTLCFTSLSREAEVKMLTFSTQQ